MLAHRALCMARAVAFCLHICVQHTILVAHCWQSHSRRCNPIVCNENLDCVIWQNLHGCTPLIRNSCVASRKTLKRNCSHSRTIREPSPRPCVGDRCCAHLCGGLRTEALTIRHGRRPCRGTSLQLTRRAVFQFWRRGSLVMRNCPPGDCRGVSELPPGRQSVPYQGSSTTRLHQSTLADSGAGLRPRLPGPTDTSDCSRSVHCHVRTSWLRRQTVNTEYIASGSGRS